MTRLLRVIVVDDSVDDAELVLDALRGGGFAPEARIVDTAAALTQALQGGRWELVISDHAMPHFDAYGALDMVHRHDPDLPFVIVSGAIREDEAVAAMRAGAQDYLLKGNLARLAAVASRELDEAVMRRERRVAEDRLRFLALHDEPTGLPNRVALLERANELGQAGIHELGVFAIGLDRTREVANALGEEYTHASVAAAAGRIGEQLPEGSAVLGRIGEDRLAVVFRRSAPNSVPLLARRIFEACGHPLGISGQKLSLLPRIGIALHPEDGTDLAALVRASESALEQARREGVREATYSRQIDDDRTWRLLLLGDLQRAAERGELSLEYQPQVDAQTGRLAGLEALLRWRHPIQGLIPPTVFVSLAEQAGIMEPITTWVLREAVRQLKEWRSEGLDVRVSINLSALDLVDGELPERVEDALYASRLGRDALGLEITESAVVSDWRAAVESLGRLQETGARTSIDDFGAGHSSLRYLRDLPVNEMKVDLALVQSAVEDSKSAAILETVVALGRDLGLDVVAEGVEDESTLSLLRDFGCPTVQGYHLARPMPSSEVGGWVRERALAAS